MTTEEKFRAAVEVIHSIPFDGTFEPSEDMMLKLFALEKQATVGPCNVAKPYIWNVSSRAKWSAWNDLSNMSKELAMESYIEELTKVVETMSYNEKISVFMSLMGPFYELVSSDDADSQIEKKKSEDASVSSTILENYHPPTILQLYNMSKNVKKGRNPHLESKKVNIPESTRFSETVPGHHSSSSSGSSSDISNFDLLSDLTGSESSPPSERYGCSPHRSKDILDTHPFLAEKDILVLAIMNLQTSLEEILTKLDKLNILAASTNLIDLEAANENLTNHNWSLNFSGTAFALLWPVAVELYFQTFRR